MAFITGFEVPVKLPARRALPRGRFLSVAEELPIDAAQLTESRSNPERWLMGVEFIPHVTDRALRTTNVDCAVDAFEPDLSDIPAEVAFYAFQAYDVLSCRPGNDIGDEWI